MLSTVFFSDLSVSVSVFFFFFCTVHIHHFGLILD